MKYVIVIENAAKKDLREVVQWYGTRKKGLGSEFLTAVRNELKVIKSMPFSNQVRYSEVHTAVMKKFPYMIHYCVDTEIKQIVVIAVLHTSLDPEEWHKRT